MANEEFNSLLGEDLPELVGNVNVEEWADVVHVLDNGHLGAESTVN